MSRIGRRLGRKTRNKLHRYGQRAHSTYHVRIFLRYITWIVWLNRRKNTCISLHLERRDTSTSYTIFIFINTNIVKRFQFAAVYDICYFLALIITLRLLFWFWIDTWATYEKFYVLCKLHKIDWISSLCKLSLIFLVTVSRVPWTMNTLAWSTMRQALY